MTIRTNTLAVEIVAKNKANKEMDDIAKAFKRMGGESHILENQLPAAASQTSSALAGLKIAGGVAAAGIGIVAAAAAAAVVAIKAAIPAAYELATSSADVADKANDSAKRLGVSTEFITQWGFAAKLAGASSESLEKAIFSLEKASPKVLAKWGVETKNLDGTLKTAEQQFDSAREKIAGLSSSQEQAAAASQLFGRSARELLPLLTATDAELGSLRERADAMGATISTVAAEMGARFNDELDVAKVGIAAISREAGAVFQPALTEAFGAVQDVAVQVLAVIGENREEFEAFATKTVALVARGFGLLVEAGSAASHVLEGLVSIITTRFHSAFEGARDLAGQVAHRARELADDLEEGASVTAEQMVPAVKAENAARSDLVRTMGREKKERKDLIALSDQASYDLAEAESDLQEALKETSDVGVLEAARLAHEKRFRAEEAAAIALKGAKATQASVEESTQQIEAAEEELSRQRALIADKDVRNQLARTAFLVDEKGKILEGEHDRIVALLDKETRVRELSGLEIAESEINATESVLAAKRRAHEGAVELLKQEKEEVKEATRAFIEAKREEAQAETDFQAAQTKAQREKEQAAKKAERDQKHALRQEERERKEATEHAVATAKTIAGAAQDTVTSVISAYRALREGGASTVDVIIGVAEVFVNSGLEVMGAIQQQLAAKQAAATGEITADAARGAAGVGASAAETLPWFVALAVIPVITATMFALIKAFAGKYHTGGRIPGLPGEERLALVRAGEVVQTSEQFRSQPSSGAQTVHHQTVQVALQPMVGINSRNTWHRQYEASLGPSLQGMLSGYRVRLRNRRVIGRKGVGW